MKAASTVHDVVDGLAGAGFDVRWEHPPTIFSVEVVGGNAGRVLFTQNFNIPGWEAVHDLDGKQVPLRDGPDADCSAVALVVWVVSLASGPEWNLA